MEAAASPTKLTNKELQKLNSKTQASPSNNYPNSETGDNSYIDTPNMLDLNISNVLA